MNSTIARPARRLALTLAGAAIAAMGSVALAPAASAAPSQDGPSYIIDGNGVAGPDAFVVKEHGRLPVFFCDVDKHDKDKDKAKDKDKDDKGKGKAACITLVEDGGTRF
jgi:hypothetical protein